MLCFRYWLTRENHAHLCSSGNAAASAFSGIGAGGSFLMTGPGGLTFTGEITGGDAFQSQGGTAFGVNLSFAGQWSTGVNGYARSPIRILMSSGPKPH
jgi:hypothetical protein